MSTTLQETPIFFSPRQVAQRIGVHWRTVIREIDRGHLPAYRVGQQLRVSRDALDAYLEQRRVR